MGKNTPEWVFSNIQIAQYNKRNEKRTYPPSSIITAITFLKYINLVNEKEKEALPQEKQEMYKLPVEEKALKASIKEMVSLCVKDNDFYNMLHSFINS